MDKRERRQSNKIHITIYKLQKQQQQQKPREKQSKKMCQSVIFSLSLSVGSIVLFKKRPSVCAQPIVPEWMCKWLSIAIIN